MLQQQLHEGVVPASCGQMQRPLPSTVLRVHVRSPAGQQSLGHRELSPGHSTVQRGGAPIVGGIGGGSVVEEEVHHLRLATRRSLVERRGTPPVLLPHVRAPLDEPPCHLAMPGGRGHMQRCGEVSVLGIGARPVLQQQACQGRMPVVLNSSSVQWRLVERAVSSVNARLAAEDQVLGVLQQIAFHGVVERVALPRDATPSQ
mmetsp:Transcript_1533/g.3688  ORF Transcript_1533/g.3688 Transcript_1533/m.3688 type:complete len:202 (-) Transcript_1533:1323-1928(-)